MANSKAQKQRASCVRGRKDRLSRLHSYNKYIKILSMKIIIQAIKIKCRMLASTGVLFNAGIVFCAILYAFVQMSIVYFSVIMRAEYGTAAFLKDY